MLPRGSAGPVYATMASGPQAVSAWRITARSRSGSSGGAVMTSSQPAAARQPVAAGALAVWAGRIRGGARPAAGGGAVVPRAPQAAARQLADAGLVPGAEQVDRLLAPA